VAVPCRHGHRTAVRRRRQGSHLANDPGGQPPQRCTEAGTEASTEASAVADLQGVRAAGVGDPDCLPVLAENPRQSGPHAWRHC
jgi:hypothetical protein